MLMRVLASPLLCSFCAGEFLPGFPLLLALAFNGGDHHGLAHFETLKATIGADGNGGGTAESGLIKDLLIMFAAIGFFTCGQDVLGLGMRESDMLLRMALFSSRNTLLSAPECLSGVGWVAPFRL